MESCWPKTLVIRPPIALVLNEYLMLLLLIWYLLVLLEILKDNPCEQVVFHAKYHTFSSGPTKSWFYHKIWCESRWVTIGVVRKMSLSRKWGATASQLLSQSETNFYINVVCRSHYLYTRDCKSLSDFSSEYGVHLRGKSIYY